MERGIQSVTTAGIVLKEMWSAGSLAWARPVSETYNCFVLDDRGEFFLLKKILKHTCTYS